MPITWREVERGLAIEEFTLQNAPARIAKKGDLWAGLLPGAEPRFDLGRLVVPIPQPISR